MIGASGLKVLLRVYRGSGLGGLGFLGNRFCWGLTGIREFSSRVQGAGRENYVTI